jgi:hypothetical protein
LPCLNRTSAWVRQRSSASPAWRISLSANPIFSIAVPPMRNIFSKNEQVLGWCTSVLGPVEVMSDHSKMHGGHESSTCRLRTAMGFCYLKVHQTPSHWHNEVHAYERWAGAFGDFAPRLLAVRDEAPLALVISELPGQIVEGMQLSLSQEWTVWRAAGAALVALHDLGTGECFGPCLRDGTCTEAFTQNAREYVSRRLKSQVERAVRGGYINDEELATIRDRVRARLRRRRVRPGRPAQCRRADAGIVARLRVRAARRGVPDACRAVYARIRSRHPEKPNVSIARGIFSMFRGEDAPETGA